MSNVPSVLSLAAALLLAACASQPPSRKDAALEDTPRHCLRSTGTQLPLREGQCVNGPGRVVTREDLERSGASSTAEALNRILPY